MTNEDRAPKTPPPLPGDCLPIPRVRAEVRDARGQTRWVLETHVVAGLDLDGCGSPVVLVPPDRQDLSESGFFWRLFIRRGDCGHELGTVVGMGEPVARLGRSHGLRDFGVTEAVAAGDEGSQGVGQTTYRFDGERYVGGRTEYL